MTRRTIVLFLACALLWVLPGVATGGAEVADGTADHPAPVGEEEPMIVVSHSGYTGAVVGEVMNTGSARREGVAVEASFYDAEQDLLATRTHAVELDQVAPGATSPFMVLNGPPDWESYDVTIIDQGSAVTGRVAGGITVLSSTPTYGKAAVTVAGRIAPRRRQRSRSGWE